MCRIACGTYFTLKAECTICNDSVALKEGDCSDIWDHLQTVHALVKFCQEDLMLQGKDEDDVKQEVRESDEAQEKEQEELVSQKCDIDNAQSTYGKPCENFN